MSDADRPAQRLTGPALAFDLAAELAQLRDEGRWAGGRSARTLVKEPDFRVVLIALHAGARLEQHHAPGPLAIQSLAGRLRLQLAEGPVELPAGHLLTLERAVPHDVEALEESAFLLTIGWPDPGTVASPPSEG